MLESTRQKFYAGLGRTVRGDGGPNPPPPAS